MKSFRLYFPRRNVAPERVVSNYEPAELACFREQFVPVAKGYRRYASLGPTLIVVGFACVFLSMAFPILSFWLVGGIFFCFLVGMFVSLPQVVECPACQNMLETDIGSYCPECGARAIQRDISSGKRSCASCGKALRRGRRNSRLYTIRACTHCGVLLDEKGI
jgi:predicted RNA-binding Zn-ribbon protein involved in translation (DUF1610 family)